MDGLLKKFFDHKLGHFLQVDPNDMHCSLASGQIFLKQAEFKAEVFDQLHFPVAVRGGFIEEMSMDFSATSIFSTSGHAKVVIKNVSLVLGPHTSDWSWQHVYECKTKLVELAMKVYELKHKEKTKEKNNKGGYFAEMKRKVQEDLAKQMLGMLEVTVSNIHFRYEDPFTQATPFACGFKIGFVGVTSLDEDQSAARQFAEPSATGDWKYSTEQYTDPLFSQSVVTRRISAYWDIGKAGSSTLFASKPVGGQEVRANFRRLNLRETFSACVVEKICEIFPPGHRRRKWLDGPSFRERLDFHQYVLFPSSLSAHVVANRHSDATKAQKAPLKDADVLIERLEVAVDTEQVRSMNELVSYAKEFMRKDQLFRTRPRESIRQYLEGMAEAREPSSSSTAPAGGDAASRRRKLVRDWWWHAYQGVRILCGLPKPVLNAAELKQKAQMQEKYVQLCIESIKELEKDPSRGLLTATSAVPGPTRQLRELQVSLPLGEILQWRHKASHLPGAAALAPQDETPQPSEAVEDGGEGAGGSGGGGENGEHPKTLQANIHLKAFQAFLLVCADRNWAAAMAANQGRGPEGAADEAPSQPLLRRPPAARGGGRAAAVARELVVKGQVLDVRLQAVQKGRKNRVARWLELAVGSVSADNCSTKKQHHSVRQILTLLPYQQQEESGGQQACLFIGLTTLEAKDKNREVGDAPLGSVLEPWIGLASHLKRFPAEETPEQLSRLGFLRDYKDELGRLMTFAYVRVGLVRVLDYTPFRRRLVHFLKRGRSSMAVDMVRRPSPAALDRALLEKLQRKVEVLVGKHHMLGTVDVQMDGMRSRMVDHYNMKHALCKEAALAPLHVRLLRNGCPQALQVQIKRFDLQPKQQDDPAEAAMSRFSSLSTAFRGTLRSQDMSLSDMLPWKAAMHLLPKADFAMGVELADETRAAVARASLPQPGGGDPRGGGLRSIGDARDGRGIRGDSMFSSRDGSKEGAAQAPLPGTYFRKWGRNGRSRLRYVVFDESIEAVAWKARETDRAYHGAIPLSKIQDICSGIRTPVLKQVKHAQLQPDCAWSVVATDRTLDLQADSAMLQTRWVTWLRARYKRYVQKVGLEGSHYGLMESASLQSSSLLKAAESRTHAYPAAFRPPAGELCALRTSCRKLQAISSFSHALEAAGRPINAQVARVSETALPSS